LAKDGNFDNEPIIQQILRFFLLNIHASDSNLFWKSAVNGGLYIGFKEMKSFYTKLTSVPPSWNRSCANIECTLHQLSPFIGKLKSSIAQELIMTYSKPGDIVADPFAGSGTVPLEALLTGRKSFSADINPYAEVLCKGKLTAPQSCELALEKAEKVLDRIQRLPDPDLRKVPFWVRQFFHPKTLKEIIRFSEYCRKYREYFLFACLLGILHHQRPGFLSFPSSHLVPYLRSNKYPHKQYPKMYEYRELKPRLLAKIRRAYSRHPGNISNGSSTHLHCSIERLKMPEVVDCLITSPPYMNALDYTRDNRLRLWFIKPNKHTNDNEITRKKNDFVEAMSSLAKKLNFSLKSKGYCILIIGERIARSPKTLLSYLTYNIMKTYAPELSLQLILEDKIPDIRRSRRDYKGTKAEHFLVFKKN